MKLELKHIAPYLPYGLKYYPSEKSDLFHDCYADNNLGTSWNYITALENKDDFAIKLSKSYLIPNMPFIAIEDGELFLGQFTSSLGFDVDDVFISEVKPILRNISDLNQKELLEIVNHIFRDSKGIRPKQDSVKVCKGYVSFYDLNTMQSYVAVKPSCDGTPLLNMSNCFEDYEVFFKLHVDMYNLIEKGLAIDVNTIES